MMFFDVCFPTGNWNLPEGIKAYVVTGYDTKTGTVTLSDSPLEGTPNGVPLILLKDADGNGSPDGNLGTMFIMTSTDATEAADINSSVPETISPLFTAGDGSKTVAELIAAATDPNFNPAVFDPSTFDTSEYLLFKLDHDVFKAVSFTNGSVPAAGACFLIVSKFDVLQMVHNGVTPPSGEARQRTIALGLGGSTTGIEENAQGTMHHAQSDGEWYTLDGRRLSGQPTVKGVYINNRKKIVVKN